MRRRSGFTITELLVAMALIVFVMSILATAFSEGMRTFRALKSIGDMNQRMRTASSMLQDDLQAPHFSGRRRLSDLNFWTTTRPPEFGPPGEGFFRVWQGSPLTAPTATNPNPPYCQEGVDIDYNIDSVRATDHILHFTVKKLGNDPKDFFRTGVPAGSPLLTFGNFLGRYQDDPNTGISSFTSQWAEVAWFLRANGQNANGTPLFTLYRHQRVIVGNPETGGAPGSAGTNLNWTDPPIVPASNYNDLSGTGINYLGMSCRQRNNKAPSDSTGSQEVYFNSPKDLTVPQYRFSMQPGVDGGLPAAVDPITGAATYYIFQPQGTGNVTEEQTNPNIQGADAVITDVLSFAVRVQTPTSGIFVDLNSSTLGGSANPLFAKATGPFVFDTWSKVVDDTVDYSLWNGPSSTAKPNVAVPLQVPITAIQIQLRVWDNKTEQTRQMTIVVDM